jgi:hypothetical protein
MLKKIHILTASVNAVISELYVGYTMTPLSLTKPDRIGIPFLNFVWVRVNMEQLSVIFF